MDNNINNRDDMPRHNYSDELEDNQVKKSYLLTDNPYPSNSNNGRCYKSGYIAGFKKCEEIYKKEIANYDSLLNKRTKGEWYGKYPATQPKDQKYSCFIKSEIREFQTKIIAKVFGDNAENSEANAAFICKAVNNYDSLLEALKLLITQFERVEPLYSKDTKIINLAKAAIQKADQ